MEETTVNNTSPRKGMSPMIWIVLIVLLVLIGGAFMVMNNKSSNTASSTAMTESPTAAPTAMAMDETGTMSKDSTTPAESMSPSGAMTDENTVTVDMEAGSYYYNPKTITVKKGQKVVINFKAVDMMHNFNIDELNVHSPTTTSGNSTTIEFTADKVGTFEYYCAIGQHRKLGQIGSLIVQ
jgi:heme/copper-type cytochrome/quinol oxidase subunit 2